MFRRPHNSVSLYFFQKIFAPLKQEQAAEAAANISEVQQTMKTSNSSKYANGLDVVQDENWMVGQYRPEGGSSAVEDAEKLMKFDPSKKARELFMKEKLEKLQQQGGSDDDNGVEDATKTPTFSAAIDAAANNSNNNSNNEKAVQKRKITTDWMVGAEWASIGDEFKGVDPKKFLKRVPDGFLTPRAQMDVQPAEELLSDFIQVIDQTYKGVDVRDPSTVASRLEIGEGQVSKPPSWLTMGGQVRAVSEFISGHLAHQVSLPIWQKIFDLKHMEMDLMYWLYVIHIHIVCRRATSCNINTWSRRREVMEELVLTMYDSWAHTSEEVMGRPPLTKIRNYIKEMYFVTAMNIDEALMHDGPGGDLALLGTLVKFCPLPRPEDIPMYTYYTLVHYIRFHVALFDRISDDEFSRGNFNFFSPDDPAVFKSYSDIQFDEVIREWKAAGEEGREPSGENVGTTTTSATEKAETTSHDGEPEGKSEEKK